MILRRALLTGLAGLAACPAWRAEAAALPDGMAPADQAAIEDVIRRQMQAFQRDDAAGAYGFAAPPIKRLFPDADQFLAMVRRGYPAVYRPRSMEFTGLLMRDGALVQSVELVGPDGAAVVALYTMEKGADGQWRIAACELTESARLGV